MSLVQTPKRRRYLPEACLDTVHSSWEESSGFDGGSHQTAAKGFLIMQSFAKYVLNISNLFEQYFDPMVEPYV